MENKEIKLTREEILEGLQKQFEALREDDPREWPAKFEAHGCMVECNFGGKLVILGNSGEQLIHWSDWADTAIDHELTVAEIIPLQDPDDKNPDSEWKQGFKEGPHQYYLDEFMRI
jgi:hypothetical protein